MAGLGITVCLPAHAAERVEAAVSEAMAPFEIGSSPGERLHIWDSWYVTGGSIHGGGFNVLPGHELDPRLIHESKSRWLSEHQPQRNEFGWCAGGPRDILDFAASREEARDLAEAAWQKWQELATGLPAAAPWLGHYYDLTRGKGRTHTVSEASAEYRAQPLVKAFDDYVETLPLERYSWHFLGFGDPVVDVGRADRKTFVEQRTRVALRDYNVLTLDGWWYEDGGPGIHGACPGPAKCPHEPELPTDQASVNRYLIDLSGDTLLVHVHCHV